MYILQLLTLENEVAKLYSGKQSLFNGIVNLKEKIISEKDDEIKRLENKLINKYSKIERTEQIDILDNQFKKIDEFITSGARRISVSKPMRAYKSVIDEMNKYKLILHEIVEKFKSNKQQEMQLYLEKISNDLPDLAKYFNY